MSDDDRQAWEFGRMNAIEEQKRNGNGHVV